MQHIKVEALWNVRVGMKPLIYFPMIDNILFVYKLHIFEFSSFLGCTWLEAYVNLTNMIKMHVQNQNVYMVFGSNILHMLQQVYLHIIELVCLLGQFSLASFVQDVCIAVQVAHVRFSVFPCSYLR